MEPSWGVLEASWERLGVVLGRLGSILARQTFQDMIFRSIFHGFGFRFEPWELQKSLIFLGFFNVFCVSVVFNINDDLGWILVSTWLHFGAVWAPKTCLGSVLAHLGASWGHLGGVLELLGGVLGRLGRVLRASWKRLGTSWGRLGSILEASWKNIENYWFFIGFSKFFSPNINLTR